MRRTLLALTILFLAGVQGSAQDSKENADFKLAVNLYNDKLYDLALEQFKAFVNLYPNTAQGTEARFYLGLSQSKLGKHDDARMTFQNFALSYPDHVRAPEAWMNVAEEYAAAKNEREAAMAFERVKTFHPKSKFAPQALLKAAGYYEKLGDTENARRVLKSLTQEFTTTEVLPARLELAAMLIADSEFEQARQECKRVVDATSDPLLKSRALLLMARSLIGQGKAVEAEASTAEITKSYRSTPSYYDALFALGQLKNAGGSIDDAMAAWKMIVDDSVKAPRQLRQNAYMEMAEANDRVREFERALFLFQRAGDTHGSRTGEAFYRAGVDAERMSDWSKAAFCYSHALADSAGKADPRAILIGAFKGAKYSKSYVEALRLANEYRRQFPADLNLPHLLVEAAHVAADELDDCKSAIEFCQSVIDRFPSSEWVDDALYALGEAQAKAGSVDQAISTFEDLQRRYPSSEFVTDAQAHIRSLKAFHQRDRDASLQKLALLVGDVIAQKSRGDLAYRLAEIYFSDLKDYQLAAVQYAAALDVDLDESLRPAAWLGIAQSYELLALREGEKSVRGKEFLLKSAAAYDSLAARYPAGELSDQAVVTAFTLRLRCAEKMEDIRRIGTEFLTQSSGTRGKDVALLALGDTYFSGKEYESAALTYKLLLEKYGDRKTAASARYQLGMALSGMMEKDSAILVLDHFLSAYPDHPKSAAAAAYLAQAAADSGQLARTLSYCSLLRTKYSYNPFAGRADLYEADAYFAVNDFKNARESYQRELDRLHADFFTVGAEPEIERRTMYRLGVCSEKLGDATAAKQWFAGYVARDGVTETAARAYYALASIAKTENNIDLAGRYLQQVDRISKKSGGEYGSIAFEAAEMLFRNEKYAEAIPKYQEAFAAAKNDTAKQYIQSRIVVSFFNLDNIKEAERRANEFVKTYSHTYNDAAEFEFERGKYQLRKEDLTDARSRFYLILRKYPKAPIVPKAMFWTARVFELDQKMQQAVHVYDSLLQCFPRDPIVPRVHLSLGNAYYNLEQWDAASKQYRIVLDNEDRVPDLVPMAMSNLIMTYKEMELFDGALELTRKYIERFPDEPDVIDKKIDIGVLYQKMGYYDQSVLQLQSLIEAGNADLESELRYYIGEAYFYKKDYQQAILEFLKVPYLVTQHGKVDWISTSYYMAGQSYEKMSKFDQAMTMYKLIVDRKDTDTQFKTAAQKEIDRVKVLAGKNK